MTEPLANGMGPWGKRDTETSMPMKIPEQWTFKTEQVAGGFDLHVREQLPWYELATRAVGHIAQHYIPKGGIVVDVGASTGNIGRTLEPILKERNACFIAIEESEEMAKRYIGPKKLVVGDALHELHRIPEIDFCICFLVLMFIPITQRRSFLDGIVARLRRGGALCIVDKITTPSGYAGTCLRRMAMKWKLESGVPASEILAKELSLSGYQRPMDPKMLDAIGARWFQFGEFTGWLIERPEID